MSTETAPATDVAEAWAQYARLRSLYPSENRRVTASWEMLRDCLRGTRVPVLVALAGAGMQAGDTFLKVEIGSNMAWLRDRLRTAGLDGVRFSPGVEREALELFTKRLLELFRRGAGTQDDASRWPESYEGIELVQRRFAGGFGADDEQAKIEAGGAGAGEGTGAGMDGEFEPGSREAFLSRLTTSGPVSERMRRISKHLAAGGLSGRAGAAMAPQVTQRMLEYVVQCIPIDSLDDNEEAMQTASEILGSVEEILGAEGLARLSNDDADPVALRALVYAASRRLFQRAPPKPREGVLKERERGRKGDDRVTDDLAELIGEVATLPHPAGDPLNEYGALLHPGERVRMQLHLIASSEEAGVVETCGGQLREMLVSASPNELLDLRSVIQDVWIDAADPAVRVTLARYFREARLASVLRACGLLSSESVVASYPQDFGLYIDSLDFTRHDEAEECRQTLEAIAPEEIEAHPVALVDGPESLLENNRLEHLLSTDSRLVLPYISATARFAARPTLDRIQRFLRQHARNVAAIAVLEISDEAVYQQGEFLAALATCAGGGQMPLPVQGSVAVTLTAIARDKDVDLARRVRAIQALGQLGRPGVETTLLDLIKQKRFFFFPREPLPVRAAAQHALQQHRVAKAMSTAKKIESSHGSIPDRRMPLPPASANSGQEKPRV